MILGFLSVCLPALLLMLIVSRALFGNVIRDNFLKLSENATESLIYQLEYYFSGFTKSTQTLLSDGMVQDFLTANSAYSAQDLQGVEKELRSYIYFNFPETVSAVLISGDMRIVSMGNEDAGNFLNEPWYNNYLPAVTTVLPTHMAEYPVWRGHPAMSIVIPIYDISNIHIVGKLVIDISLNEIAKMFGETKIGKTGVFFILSPDNTIVYHPNKEWQGVDLSQTPLSVIKTDISGQAYVMYISGVKSLVSMSGPGSQQWRIVSVVDYSEMDGELQAAQKATILVFLLIIFGLILLVPFISGTIIKPLVEFKRLMGRVAEGDLSTRAEDTQGKNEFSQLNRSFNTMTEQLSELMTTVADMKVREMELILRQKEAAIAALQNQINPHLLYNSLDIIKSIAYLEEVPKIVTMASSLGDVYRYSAQLTEAEVTLRDEILNLEKYFEIIKVRFPKNFESQILVNEAFYNCACQRLILQPIAENSVKYAVEPRGGKSVILVSAYSDGGDLIVEIADDGPGIPEKRLTFIKRQFIGNSDTINKNPKQGGGFGLSNVHARLVLKYGEKYGLRIDSFIGRATVVSVRIPYKRVK